MSLLYYPCETERDLS